MVIPSISLPSTIIFPLTISRCMSCEKTKKLTLNSKNDSNSFIVKSYTIKILHIVFNFNMNKCNFLLKQRFGKMPLDFAKIRIKRDKKF